MAIIPIEETGKHYFMDGWLKENLDFLVKRKNRGFDNVLLIDGDERIGKSTFAKQIAYYMAKQTGTTFTHENIFFDIEEMQKFAKDTRKSMIIWDEAALGGTADNWQDENQKRLIQLLTTCGKYHHFFIFVIPQFDRLKYYLAISRSIALLRVYSPNRLDRGFFRCYGKNKKKEVYMAEKEKKEADCFPSFYGRFPDTHGMLIDEDAYEARKDAAIQAIGETTKAKGKVSNLQMHRFATILRFMKEKEKYTYTKIAEILGVECTEVTRIASRNWLGVEGFG
jgi:hypothetical protein